MVKNREINGTGEIGLVTPTPAEQQRNLSRSFVKFNVAFSHRICSVLVDLEKQKMRVLSLAPGLAIFWLVLSINVVIVRA